VAIVRFSDRDTGGGTEWVTVTGSSTAICPDLLSLRDIGVADNWRGRVIRAFFKLMEYWPAR